MTFQIRLGCIAGLAALAWALTGRAAEPCDRFRGRGAERPELDLGDRGHGGDRDSDGAWDRPRRPAQSGPGVELDCGAGPVPMPSLDGAHKGGAVLWQFRGATEEAKHGRQVTLRFTCDHPAMELKSVWRALPGPGPVENEVTIENRSQGNVVFPPTLVAAKVDLAADGAVTLHRARKTNVGIGEVLQDVIGPTQASRPIPPSYR